MLDARRKSTCEARVLESACSLEDRRSTHGFVMRTRPDQVLVAPPPSWSPPARELLSAFDLGQSPFVDLGDSGEGADVLAVLLRQRFQGLQIGGNQLHRLGQSFVPFRELLQPLVDGHVISV